MIDSEAFRWTFLAAINIPVYLGIGYFFFDGLSGFWKCVRFWLTPDLISLFRGEYWEDTWSSLKLFAFIAVCSFIVYGEYKFFFGDPLKPKVASINDLPNPMLLDRSLEGSPKFLVTSAHSVLTKFI